MSPEFSATITATATVLAATVGLIWACGAAFFAFIASILNLRVSRRNAVLQARITQQVKHAEFRQKWIDDLRSDMAQFHTISYEDSQKGEAHIKAFPFVARIMLRMNRDDPLYDDLMAGIAEIIDKGCEAKEDVWLQNHRKSLQTCQAILRSEWLVLKGALHDISYIDPPRKRLRS